MHTECAEQLAGLYQRGARRFKFVDRTFNLKIDASLRILQFFLDRLDAPAAAGAVSGPGLFVHFEVIPDHLPQRLKDSIARFPPGVLQFEIGIQSFNADVQRRISRRQDNELTVENLRWLTSQSHAHLHTDLIFGLPGETLDSFAQGFDRLVALRPHEIQVGILKRLRGTPITRHTLAQRMVYDDLPPYAVRETAAVSSQDVLRVTRFARYWDLLANSGRFRRTLALLVQAPQQGMIAPDTAGSAFFAFLRFSDWLWSRTERTHALTQEQLVDLVYDFVCIETSNAPAVARDALLEDYLHSGARARPTVLRSLLQQRTTPVRTAVASLGARQGVHLAQVVA